MADVPTDATLPGEPSASVPTSETAAVQTGKTEAAPETTSDAAATMSGALQSPDAPISEAPEDSKDAKINGEAPQPAPTAETAAVEDKLAETGEDTEMKEGAEDSTVAEPAGATDTTDAPASSKKQANGKRKSVGGVPEHKNKKLNKKKSLQKITHLDAKPGEYYFARLKSYPPWPSVICDEQMLPNSLLSTRPVTTMQPDGTYKEPYADGGKRAHERTLPVMFLHTNEFAWIPNTDLTPLTPEECQDVAEKGKSKSLINAYKVAAEAHDLQHFKDMLLDHERAIQEDQDRRDAREAEKAAKAAKTDTKKKRKSTDAAAADDDVDMEDVPGDEDAEVKPKGSKKRKKAEADSEAEAEKPAKTPKTATKLKLTTPKAPTPAESNKKAKDSAKPSKAKTPKEKKAKGEEEEETTSAPKKPEKPLDPAEEKAKKEREVLFLRHKLQKGFLSREQAPKEEEMKQMSDYIQKLENYGGELEVSVIRATKVNKVLKAIIKLNTIPKDEEFNFRKRAHDLLESWNKLLGSDGGDGGGSKDEPATNGDHKDEDAEAEPAPKVAAPTEAADAAAAEEAPLPEAPVEAKETIVEGMIDGPAASGAVAAEADKPADEVKNDAEETEPSTAAPAKTEMEGIETA